MSINNVDELLNKTWMFYRIKDQFGKVLCENGPISGYTDALTLVKSRDIETMCDDFKKKGITRGVRFTIEIIAHSNIDNEKFVLYGRDYYSNKPMDAFYLSMNEMFN